MVFLGDAAGGRRSSDKNPKLYSDFVSVVLKVNFCDVPTLAALIGLQVYASDVQNAYWMIPCAKKLYIRIEICN